MGGAAAASAGMQLAGSIGGWIAQGVTRKQNRRAFEKIVPPEVADALYDAAIIGDVDQIEALIQQYPSIMEFQEDPKLKIAQMQALEGLGAIGQEGFTPEDKAAIQAANLQAGVAAQGAMGAESQRARMMGVGGSGMEQARRAMAQQQGVNRMFGQAADIGLAGRQRALQGLQAAGQLGGQIRGQEFGQAAEKSRAQQAIDAANIANRMSAQQQNIANQLQVNLANQQARLAKAASEDEMRRAKLGLDIEKAKFGERKN